MTDTRHLLSMVFLFISFAFPNWCPGQGTVIFSNYAAPGLVTNGLTAQPAEVGTTFSVGLYFAQDGVTDAALFLQIGSPIHVILPGVFNGRTYTAPTLIPGGFGMFQVRVWETSFGSTYEEALANGSPQNGRLALAGESGIMRVHTGNPTLTEPTPPAALVGWPAVVGSPLSDGFVLNVVPEPASWRLLLLALSLLLVRHRRSRRT